MKHKFLLILIVYFVQIAFLFGGVDLANQKIHGDPENQNTREDLLNDRHYQFFDYQLFSSGFYTAEFEIQINKDTNLRLIYFAQKYTSAMGSVDFNYGSVDFNYEYYISNNNLYFDSVIKFVADDKILTIVDDFPRIYKSLTKNGSLTFRFSLTELSAENLANIANAEELKIFIDTVELDLSEGQTNRVQDFIRAFYVNNITYTDMEYLSSIVDIEYVDTEELVSQGVKKKQTASLFKAIENNEIEAVQEAIDSDIDINEKNEEGLTPLMFAATKSSEPDIISLLINNGASIDEKDEDGWTPLMKASAFNENPEVVQRFIEEGADPNKQGEDGETPLNNAIGYNRNSEVIEILIRNGADVNIADKDTGDTPIMELWLRAMILSGDPSYNNDQIKIAKMLIDAGAEVNAKNKSGSTALTTANNSELENLLIENGAKGPTHIAWEKRFYVDSFGDSTEEPYIANIGRIEGTFSNTATNNSLLEAYFIIDNSNKIALKLFEYGRDNPVKSYGNKKYELLVKDATDTVHELYGTNYSDRITLNESSSNTLHNLLIDNNKLKIHIVESDNRTTTYDFELDARGYDYIYNEFFE